MSRFFSTRVSHSLSSVYWANNLHFFLCSFFLHVQLCRQLSQKISHRNLWVSCQVEEAPTGFFFFDCFLPTHIQRFFHSLPVSPCKSWQPSQYLKHKRKRVHLNTVPGCRGDAECWYCQKEKKASEGPQ